MSRVPLKHVQIVHENLATVMTYAYSFGPLSELIDTHFPGEWKPLREALFDTPRSRADRAIIELAIFLRLLDDSENLADYLKASGWPSFGKLQKDGLPDEEIHLRDMTNKFVHAASFDWNLSDPDRPLLICNSGNVTRWRRAEIDLLALAGFCGALTA